jgi:hypothetical protein
MKTVLKWMLQIGQEGVSADRGRWLAVVSKGTKLSDCKLIENTSHYKARAGTVRLEKLTVSQPVNKFPAVHANSMSITVFTTARDLSLY